MDKQKKIRKKYRNNKYYLKKNLERWKFKEKLKYKKLKNNYLKKEIILIQPCKQYFQKIKKDKIQSLIWN